MDGKKKFEGKYSELTGTILRAFFQIHKEMGFGFSEPEIEVGLLLNFGSQAEFHRKIYDNSRKGTMSWIKNP